MSTTEMTPADVLAGAKELLETGWVQRTYVAKAPTGDLCYCTRGALRAAAGGKSKPDEAWVSLPADQVAYDAYLAAVGLVEQAIETRALGSPITAWNDYPDRTKDEVLAMMGRALELASA